MVEVDVVIVGAGISGLVAAHQLAAAGRRILVVEARDQPGGRVRSVRDPAGRVVGDLGPTWVWPDAQPIAAAWLARLGLETFAQLEDGLAIVELDRARPPIAASLPPQAGSVRLVGGTQALIDRLVARLPAEAIRTAAPVTGLEVEASSVIVSVGGAEPRAIRAGVAVIATPPRIARGLAWRPPLPAALATALAATPTWMAPHAKVVIQYERAFWRERGLSGRIASRVGPMVEVHDHCGPRGEPAALFGFLGWPHHVRQQLGAALEDHVAAQLARCFGRDAPAPVCIAIEDWAGDPRVTVAADLEGDAGHPDVAPAVLRQAHLGGRIWLAPAETSDVSPGLIEGAIVAGERAAARVLAAR